MTIQGPCSASSVPAILLEGVQRGEEDAFDELYNLTHVQVARVVTALLRSPEHAAEVVQEVYLYVWQNAGSFDEGRGAVLAWLMMLARRRAVDRVRHVVRAQRRDQNSAGGSELVVPDVAEIGMARHEAAQLRCAVGQLTTLQRDAVVLTFLDGYTHQQAAQLLSVPLGTLKTRVRAGVLNLRDHLDTRAA